MGPDVRTFADLLEDEAIRALFDMRVPAKAYVADSRDLGNLRDALGPGPASLAPSPVFGVPIYIDAGKALPNQLLVLDQRDEVMMRVAIPVSH